MMATTVLPVPTILNILSDSNDSYFDDQNIEAHTPRAKKRRLDHLSWEEKIQRKKLKNRVAAQTSRDRKKAKLEQMESAIQQLFTKNENIEAECEKLKEANERLQAENAELNKKLQESTSSGEDIPRKVVGSPSKELESSGSEMVDKKMSVEQDISEYLLLHHNYAKTQPKENDTNTHCRKPHTSIRKLKTLRPKVTSSKSKFPVKSNLPVQPKNIPRPQEKLSDNNELLYGTYDENTNTITIVVNEDSVPLNEVIVGDNITSLENNNVLDTNIPMDIDVSSSLTVPAKSEGSLSPRSDLGYESLDSPLSNSDLENWDQSVSELFPSLF